jgi:hypothetical protein
MSDGDDGTWTAIHSDLWLTQSVRTLFVMSSRPVPLFRSFHFVPPSSPHSPVMDSPTSSTSGSSSSGCSSTSTADPADAAIYGEGSYYNIRRGIELRAISDDFSGLFATEPLKKGTIVWKNRGDGPAEEKYRKIYGEDIQHLTPSELRYFIRYSYQNDDDLFISPLNEEEVNYDYSNFWNHSCDPCTLPLDEDHWVAIRDIKAGEQLTIDYSTFDSNESDPARHGTRLAVAVKM